MTIITGIIADSAASPDGGVITWRQAQRFDDGTIQVTRNTATARVVDGALQTMDGDPFTMPPSPAGTVVLVTEIFNGERFSFYTQIPSAVDVEYRQLAVVECGPPGTVPPSWVVEVLAAQAGAEVARDEAEAAAAAAAVSAADAAASAAEALVSETAAAGSATAAAGSATTAQAAQVESEAARDISVNAAVSSGGYAATAEAAKVGAETARDEAQAIADGIVANPPTLQQVTDAGSETTTPVVVRSGPASTAIRGEGTVGVQGDGTNIGVYANGDSQGLYAGGGNLGAEIRSGGVGALVRGGTTAVDAASESGPVAVFDAANGNPSDVMKFKADGVTVAAIKNDGRISHAPGTDPGDGVVKSQLDAAVAGATIPDATTTVKGKIRLAGDLAGTADAPTVPGLAGKADTVHTHVIGDVTGLQGALDGKADLVGGLIPASQLPAYVDDVLEFATFAEFPAVGESGKLYLAADQANRVYRWIGSDYVDITGDSLVLGETSSTAYRGDRGKSAYDHSLRTDNPHGITKAQIGLGSVEDTSDAAKPISTATQAALDGKVGLTGSQTVAGVKTFSSSPIVPAATTATQAINKEQLDAALLSPVTTIFDWNGGGWRNFVIPDGAKRLSISCVGGGGNGGAGFSSPSGSTGGGGGGGGGGAMINVEVPVDRIGQSFLRVFVAGGGTTSERSVVAIADSPAGTNILAQATSGSNGGNGTSGAAGSAGSAAAPLSSASWVAGTVGLFLLTPAQAGAVGGSPAGAAGATVTWGGVGSVLSGGAGGGGCTSTDFAGGDITNGSSVIVWVVAGGTAGGGAGRSGGAYPIQGFFTGGSGGGSNNFGTGGAGGDGAIGSGGGGGGSGITGGAGGKGGRGQVRITAIF